MSARVTLPVAVLSSVTKPAQGKASCARPLTASLLCLPLLFASCKTAAGPEAAEPTAETHAASAEIAEAVVAAGGPAHAEFENIPPVLETESTGQSSLTESDLMILAFISQSFEQAALAAGASIEIPPYFQVAAREITPLRLPGSEQFTGCSARGSVYIRVDYLQPLVGFCEQAAVTEQQVRMTGYPVVLRGNTVLKGTAAHTVFLIRGSELEIDGPHESVVAANLPVLPPADPVLPLDVPFPADAPAAPASGTAPATQPATPPKPAEKPAAT